MEKNNLTEQSAQYEALLTILQRSGVEDLMAWLHGSDVYTAPLEPKGSFAYEGAAVQVALVTYQKLMDASPDTDMDTLIIVSLLWILGRVAIFKPNPNDADGKRPYLIERGDKDIPLPRNAKAALLAMRLLPLTKEECVCLFYGEQGVCTSEKDLAGLEACKKQFPLLGKLQDAIAEAYATIIAQS